MMELADLGAYRAVEELTKPFKEPKQSTTDLGIGDDAALLLQEEGSKQVVATQLLLEGIHFDLVYVPLRYLGYKAVTRAVSNIIAMGGTPRQILVGLGVSQRFTMPDLQMLMKGIEDATLLYQVDVVGGDTTTSLTGLTISLTAIGTVKAGDEVRRDQAGVHDLICVTGNLGAAYMGLQLLERERSAYDGTDTFEPDFAGREYILQRQLKPTARLDSLRALQATGIRPTAMIDLTDGLANDLLKLCLASGKGARIYEHRLPIDHETVSMAQDFGLSPTTVALNGGEDYELLLTIPLGMKDLADAIPDLHQIGYITDPSEGCRIVNSGGSETTLTSQSFPQGI